MRILLHDFAGHAFVVPLSRALASRGHTICHTYCASLISTPQGVLQRTPDDPQGLTFEPIDLGEPLQKGAFVTRWRQERRHGTRVAELIRTFQPDVVLSGQAPLDAQARVMKAARQQDARFVFWVQDLIGLAAARLLREKLPIFGGLIGDYYARMEGSQLSRSDALVLITEDFRDARPEIARHPETHVIPNWAPLAEIPVLERDNAWAAEHGLAQGLRFVYSGTLGMKHNPGLLLALAQRFPEAEVIVVSQGAGADWLRESASGVPNLRLLPFQPFDRLPEVLAAADVLVAVLEPEAGVFSVPSKVLAYLCASRALLLAVPPENLAARIVAEHEAGAVVPPRDETGFLAAATRLAEDAPYRAACARRGRAYAEKHFDIEAVADRFEALLAGQHVYR